MFLMCDHFPLIGASLLNHEFWLEKDDTCHNKIYKVNVSMWWRYYFYFVFFCLSVYLVWIFASGDMKYCMLFWWSRIFLGHLVGTKWQWLPFWALHHLRAKMLHYVASNANILVFAKWIWQIRQICQILQKMFSFYTKHFKLNSKCSQCRFVIPE